MQLYSACTHANIRWLVSVICGKLVFIHGWCVQILANPECYHEFCRLLMRVKSNYQLGELLRLDDYNTFIELVAKFTVSSLQVSYKVKIE